MASATTKVNLKDPAVQAKVKAAGIRWRLRDYENGLELTEEQMLKAGLDAKTAKADAKAAAKAEPPVADASFVGPPKGPLHGSGAAHKSDAAPPQPAKGKKE